MASISSAFPRRNLLIAVALIVAGIAAVFGWRAMSGGPPQGMEGFAMPVEAMPAATETVTVALDTVGTLMADEAAVIRPEIAGKVTSVPLDEGSQAKKDDILVRLDDAIQAAELRQAEARLDLARTNFERAKTLKASGAATGRTYDEADAELRNAVANEELSKAKWTKTRLLAPFDGVVGLRKVSVGDFVNPGDAIVNFAKLSPLKVDFKAPERYLSELKVGQTVEVTLDGFPGQTFKGEVYALDPVVDENARSIALRAKLPNDDNRLRPGQFAHVHLTLATHENAVVLPEAAIVPVGNDSFVFTVVDGKAVNVKVTLGERLAGKVEIREGLKPGDMVVTGGQMKIQPGMPVQVMPAGGPPAQGQGKPGEKAGEEGKEEKK